MGWRRRFWPAIAVFVLLAAIASDFLIASFWATHPMLTAVLSAMAVVLVSVAVIDAVLERRDERRWRLLAQYALVDLVFGAQTVWVRLASEFEVNQAENLRPDQIQELLKSPDRAPAVRRFVADSLVDGARREELRRALDELSEAGRQRLTDWAAVMTRSRSYAELFDQHVELYAQVRSAEDYLRYGFRRGLQYQPSDVTPQDEELFLDQILSVVNLAVGLQNQTWALILQVVPFEWWRRRIDERVAAAHSNLTERHDRIPPG